MCLRGSCRRVGKRRGRWRLDLKSVGVDRGKVFVSAGQSPVDNTLMHLDVCVVVYCLCTEGAKGRKLAAAGDQ